MKTISDQSAVIIPPPSLSFGISSLITLAIFYAKIEVDLYIRWQTVFMPTTIFLVYKVISALNLFRTIHNFVQNVSGYELRLTILWKLTQLLIFSSLIALTTFLAQFLERLDNEDERALESFKHIAVILGFVLAIYIGYSYTLKKMIKSCLHLPLQDSENGESSISKGSYIMNFVFSLMGNTMTVCAGGACNSIYVSTISAFFSAFGVPIFEYIHYLNFLVYIFMAVSLFSLYAVKHSWKYAPFLLSLFGAILIIIDMQFYDLDYLTYVGNITMIGSAIWNSRLNKRKFSFL